MKQVSRIPSIAFLLLGVLCILFPVHIAGVLPFLLGGIMLVAGVMHGGAYLRNQRFLEGESQGLGPDVVLVVMGVAFLCAGSEAIGLMGVVWGTVTGRRTGFPASRGVPALNATWTQSRTRHCWSIKNYGTACMPVCSATSLLSPKTGKA